MVHRGNTGGENHAVNEVQSGEQATEDVLQADPDDNCIEDCRNESDDQDFLDRTKEVSVIPADTSQEGSEYDDTVVQRTGTTHVSSTPSSLPSLHDSMDQHDGMDQENNNPNWGNVISSKIVPNYGRYGKARTVYECSDCPYKNEKKNEQNEPCSRGSY